MAILIRGATQCGICHKVIGDNDAVTMFSHFVANELDPLLRFSDASFHEPCFRRDPLAPRAQAVWDACKAVKMICRHCGKPIEDPDDHFPFVYFSDDPRDPAFKLNALQFHESCLRTWTGRREALDILVELRSSGKWKGRAMDSMIEVLQRSQASA